MANVGALKGIRCPECHNDTTFIIQMRSNVIMYDDGIDVMGGSQPDNDHFPGHVIPDDDGLRDDDPIECFERRHGCGHRGTVKEFRSIRGFIADARGRRFVVPGIHLSDDDLADEVNRLVRGARAAGKPTWLDREITVDHAAGGIRRWGIVATDNDGRVAIHWNTGENEEQVTAATPGAQPVTVYEE